MTTDGKTTAGVFDTPDGESLQRSVVMGSRMTYSRLIGALFLTGFLVYGVGMILVTSVLGTPDFLSTMSALLRGPSPAMSSARRRSQALG